MEKLDKEIIVNLQNGYTTKIQAGAHLLIADEPEAIGGANLGPDPYAYILAGLGACSAITLRMYADRKNWPLSGIEIRLKPERSHAADCADCEGKDVQIDVIKKTIALSGPLTKDQKARLLQISDRCPVQKTLEAGVKIMRVE